MSNYYEKIYESTLPVVTLNDTVAFPSISATLEISDVESIEAATVANESNSRVFLVCKSNIENNDNIGSNLYNVGTVAKIKQSIKTPEGHFLQVMFSGISWFSLKSIY